MIINKKIRSSFVTLLTLFEFIFLLLGVSLPLATIDEFWFFSSEFSLISLSYNLFYSKEYVLSIVIITFGLIFPIFKIMQRVFISGFLRTLPIHKFALLDIFLLSFLVFGGKISYFYEVNLQLGFYFMLSSIILSSLYLIIKHNESTNKS
jgi:hypothetical protein